MILLSNCLYYFIACFVLMTSIIFCWHKILNIKINFCDKKLYITLISLVIISLVNYFNVNPYIRIVVITLFLSLFYLYLFKNKISVSVLTPIFIQIIYVISELIFAILLTIFYDISNIDIVNSYFGTLISNTAIGIISILIICIPLTNKIHNSIIDVTKRIKKKQLIFFIFVITICLNLMMAILYYELDFIYLLIFNSIFVIFCFAIIIYTLKTQNNYIKINEKFTNTLNSLKEYEEILDKYRISTHENKNELLTIRNMVSKANKKVITYIDAIIENKLQDDEKIIFETAKIPNGGLRGLIYSKILLMKELKINYLLEISNEVRAVDLIKYIDDSTMLSICKIIGVYIDNSIQAVRRLKRRYINISMYLEGGKLVISISNNYSGKLNINKLDDIGYTTNGNNHGYGLALAKKIINSNSNLYNERKISKEVFTQVLKIKM